MDERYITTAEAAKLLDVAQVTVNRLIYKGMVKAEKFGPIWRVEKDSIDAYLKANLGKSKNDPTRGTLPPTND